MRINEATLPAAVKIWERGQLTIPKEIREDLEIDTAATLSVFRVGKNIILTPKRLTRVRLARKVEKTMRRKEITLNSLMADLREERKRYNRENYGF